VSADRPLTDTEREAVAALRENTRLQPLSPHGWYQLAHVQVERGMVDEAGRIVDRLRQFDPAVAQQLEREIGVKHGR
jgi:cytochrome c-type biogenesis protein CcmH/NrfG